MNLLSKLFGGAKPRPLSAAISRYANRPMAMLPAQMDAMLAAAATMPATDAMRDDDDWSPHGCKPEHLIEVRDGIGIIAVRGPLFQRFDGYCYWYGGTAYEIIGQAFRRLLADEGVRGIVFDLDSGGGEVSGCFDLCDVIYAARGQKPIRAMVNDNAFSACYAIGSQCDEMIVTRTSGTGSVGVRSTHLDVSKWDAEVGLKYTTITAGEKKADYDMHEPLSDSARADLQAEVDRLYVIFVDTVVRGRGLTAEAVRATEAGCYFGQAAIDVGFADRLATLDEVLLTADVAIETGVGPVSDDEVIEPVANGGTISGDAASRIELVISNAQQPGGMLSELSDAAIDDLAQRVLAAVRASGLPSEDGAAAAQRAVSAAKLPPALTLALLDPAANLTAPTVDARIDHARNVSALCAAAGDVSLAHDYIVQNTNIETVRSQLLAMKAEDGPEVITTLPASTAEKEASALAQRLNPTHVYRNLNQKRK